MTLSLGNQTTSTSIHPLVIPPTKKKTNVVMGSKNPEFVRAKAELAQRHTTIAFPILEKLASQTKDRWVKAESAIILGDEYEREGKYVDAVRCRTIAANQSKNTKAMSVALIHLAKAKISGKGTAKNIPEAKNDLKEAIKYPISHELQDRIDSLKKLIRKEEQSQNNRQPEHEEKSSSSESSSSSAPVQQVSSAPSSSIDEKTELKNLTKYLDKHVYKQCLNIIKRLEASKNLSVLAEVNYAKGFIYYNGFAQIPKTKKFQDEGLALIEKAASQEANQKIRTKAQDFLVKYNRENHPVHVSTSSSSSSSSTTTSSSPPTSTLVPEETKTKKRKFSAVKPGFPVPSVPSVPFSSPSDKRVKRQPVIPTIATILNSVTEEDETNHHPSSSSQPSMDTSSTKEAPKTPSSNHTAMIDNDDDIDLSYQGLLFEAAIMSEKAKSQEKAKKYWDKFMTETSDPRMKKLTAHHLDMMDQEKK